MSDLKLVMQGSNQPGKRIRKIRSRGIPPKERVRRIELLIKRGFVTMSDAIPPNAIPIDLTRVRFGYRGKPAKLFYIDLNFVCQDCGLLQTWFKEDQMWFYEETDATLMQTASRCRECRLRETDRVAEARRAAGHD